MRKLVFKPANAVFGLHLLSTTQHGTHRALEMSFKRRRPLEVHPFGLDLPTDNLGLDCNWAFLENGTNLSVEAMLAHLNWAISGAPNESAIENLRIFNVQYNPTRPKEHFCYFEAWTPFGIFLCGECTDFSGGGGSGNNQMRAVFSLLASLYQVEVEEFEVFGNEIGSLDLQTLGIPELV